MEFIARPGRHGYSSTNRDRKSTRLNSSHMSISYAVFCLKKKKHRDVGGAAVVARLGLGVVVAEAILGVRAPARGGGAVVLGALAGCRVPCAWGGAMRGGV